MVPRFCNAIKEGTVRTPMPQQQRSPMTAARMLQPPPQHPGLRCLKARPRHPPRADAEPDSRARDSGEPPALRCARCLQIVGHHDDVFSLDESDPGGAFVNPFGYLHEVLTVIAAQQLVVIGTPTTLNTWFAGYAWRMAFCSGCGAHMGWRFSTTEAGRVPPRFWGLSRAALAAF